MPRFPTLGRLLFAMAILAMPSIARAQDPDIIRGRITGPDSLPIENVAVTVTTIAGDITKSARTDKNGVFTVTFPDPQGDYWVTLQALGFALRRFEIKRLADEDVLVADARLAHTVTTLQAMRVRGARPMAGRGDGMNDITGLDRSLNVNGDLSTMGDLAAMAGMLPGATFIPAANGGPSGFSVFGLDPSENSFLLNGMSIGSGGLPRDANISASVSGSPYDASRGGFSGAQVSARLSSGTNFIVRTMSATGITPQMQFADRTAQSLSLLSTRGSVGGRFAGPIQMNKLFYNVSWQFDHTSRELRTLMNTDAEGLQALGVSRDSVLRLQSLLGQAQMPLVVNGFPRENLGETGSLAGVIDYSPPSATSQSFRLTFSGNGGRTLPTGFSTLELPSHSGRADNWTGSAQLQHSTYVKSVIFSSTSLGLSRSDNESSPYLDLPSASIRINSVLPDGTSGVKTIQAGGNPSLGTSSATSDVQFRNSLSWVSMDSKHRLSFTTDARQSMAQTDQSSNLLGSFSYNSLEDFEAGVPASFTRVLTPRFQRRGQTTGGVALQDSWRANQDFQMTMGIRADVGRFGSRPERNPLVEQTFGIRNDIVPNPWSLSPRVSFSKTLGEAPQISFIEGAVRGPRSRISGGIGVYQSAPSASLITRVANNTGLPSAVQQLTCVGTATPIPNWQLYLAEPNSVPGQCADGTGGTVFASSLPSVTVVDPHYAPSKRVSSDLAWRGPILNNRYMMTVSGTYALNLNQTGEIDLNFKPDAQFTLPDEGSRPVYVLPSSIVPTTGAIASKDARVSPLFNRVSEVQSNLRSLGRQMTIQLSPMTYTPWLGYSLAYTLQSNKRQLSGFSSTDGNPLERQWGLNDLNAMHQVQLQLDFRFGTTMRMGWTIAARSGAPITPRVAGDINGDGSSGNDRAYIYDPSAIADSAFKASMEQLLTSGSPIARDCLRRNLGKIAPIGACHGPWTLSGNNSINVTINPFKVRMPQRAQLRFQLGNPMGALDLLFHGANNIHGWGQQATPDQTLFYVRGFDSTTKRFKYEVNQRFGSTRPQQQITRSSPVTITALLQLDLGPTRERQQLTQLLDRGRTMPGQIAPEAQLRTQYTNTGTVPNPMISILRQADQLKLTPDQADSIATINRWYTTRLDSIWAPTAKYLAGLPKDYSQSEAYAHYKEARESSIDLLISVAPLIKNMLNSEQKRMLPQSLQTTLDTRYLRAIRSSTANQSVFF